MPKQKPLWIDHAARAKGDRPPIAPGLGAPLHAGDARLCARWLLSFARRSKVPLSPRATRRLRTVCLGQRPLDYRLYRAILNYIMRKRQEQQQRSTVRLRLGGVGLGGLSIFR